MRIHFLFILVRLIPELNGWPAEAIRALIDAARLRSTERIRKYGGWCYAGSLVIPFLLLATAAIELDLLSGDQTIFAVGLLSALASLSSSLAISVAYGLILKPAIKDLLQWKRP